MKNILVFSEFFYPAYKAGGPVKSLKNIILFLNGFTFDVITSTSDIDGTVIDDDPQLSDNCTINRVSSLIDIIIFTKNILNKCHYDYIYINSFFSLKFSLIIQLILKVKKMEGVKVIIAPRGELTKGAMSIKSKRKRLFLILYKLFGLQKNVIYQFTSPEEEYEAKLFLGNVFFRISPNMHDFLPSFNKKEKRVGEVELIFVSRISKKKNLLSICKALKKVVDVNVNFKIIGNIEDKEYWSLCLSELMQTEANVKYDYIGALQPSEVSDHLGHSQLFVLPTLNENYGHAIVEAAVFSNIVLISDQTPWGEINKNGSYVVKTDDTDNMSKIITQVANMPEEEYVSRSKNTYDFMTKVLSLHENKIRELFND